MENILDKFKKSFINLSYDPEDMRDGIQCYLGFKNLSKVKIKSLVEDVLCSNLINVYDINKELSQISSLAKAEQFIKPMTEEMERRGGTFEINLCMDICPVELRIALEKASHNSDSHLIWANHIHLYEWYENKYIHTSSYLFAPFDKKDKQAE